VRGLGLLLGIELVTDRDTRAAANELAEAVLYRCLDNGLSFKLSLGNTLTLTPPLMINEQQMHSALDIVDEAITACTRAGGGRAGGG
ncbi:MAG: hypothetical protein AB8B63_25010, partial [Granulosicoccus sp.]